MSSVVRHMESACSRLWLPMMSHGCSFTGYVAHTCLPVDCSNCVLFGATIAACVARTCCRSVRAEILFPLGLRLAQCWFPPCAPHLVAHLLATVLAAWLPNSVPNLSAGTAPFVCPLCLPYVSPIWRPTCVPHVPAY